MFPLLTLGHGTASAQEFSGIVRAAGLEAIVDVRTVPKSRRHPQYWREEMAQWIPEDAACSYRWEPALGGFRKAHRDSRNVALRNPSFRGYADYMETGDFEIALRELLEQARASRVAIVCSETLWWRCHRRLISDAAVLLHGVTVEHLLHDGKPRPHVLTDGVRAQDGKLYYDVH